MYRCVCVCVYVRVSNKKRKWVRSTGSRRGFLFHNFFLGSHCQVPVVMKHRNRNRVGPIILLFADTRVDYFSKRTYSKEIDPQMTDSSTAIESVQDTNPNTIPIIDSVPVTKP